MDLSRSTMTLSAMIVFLLLCLLGTSLAGTGGEQPPWLSFSCRAVPSVGVLLNCSVSPSNCSTPAVQGPNGQLFNATVAIATPQPGNYRCVCREDGEVRAFTCEKAILTCPVPGAGCEMFMVAVVIILVAAVMAIFLLLCIRIRARPLCQYEAPSEQQIGRSCNKGCFLLLIFPLLIVLAAVGLLIALALRRDCHGSFHPQ